MQTQGNKATTVRIQQRPPTPARAIARRSLGFLLGFLLGWTLWAAPAWALTSEQKLVNEVWRIVNRAYLDNTFNHQNWWWVRENLLRHPLNDRLATYAAIREMLGSLGDPFTRFLTPEQYRSLQTNTSGELTGVGLQIALDAQSGQLMVVAPLANSPADQAGILPQDRILAIDGQPTQAMTLDEAAERMRGRAGSQVILTVERASDGSQSDFTLVRDRIAIDPVTAEVRQAGGLNIGYLRLNQFNGNAPAGMAAAIQRLEQTPVQAYVLDLRNNPGGLLQAGIAIARQWLDSGAIVYTVNRQGVLDTFEATSSALTHAPLAVLVNRGTASASEILAGALQDDKRAVLVGERTFGKGLIQSLFDLSDGSGLAVTIAKYETPNHRDINKSGIAPDVAVDAATPPSPAERGDPATDPQYQAAVETLVTRITGPTASAQPPLEDPAAPPASLNGDRPTQNPAP